MCVLPNSGSDIAHDHFLNGKEVYLIADRYDVCLPFTIKAHKASYALRFCGVADVRFARIWDNRSTHAQCVCVLRVARLSGDSLILWRPVAYQLKVLESGLWRVTGL